MPTKQETKAEILQSAKALAKKYRGSRSWYNRIGPDSEALLSTIESLDASRENIDSNFQTLMNAMFNYIFNVLAMTNGYPTFYREHIRQFFDELQNEIKSNSIEIDYSLPDGKKLSVEKIISLLLDRGKIPEQKQLVIKCTSLSVLMDILTKINKSNTEDDKVLLQVLLRTFVRAASGVASCDDFKQFVEKFVETSPIESTKKKEILTNTLLAEFHAAPLANKMVLVRNGADANDLLRVLLGAFLDRSEQIEELIEKHGAKTELGNWIKYILVYDVNNATAYLKSMFKDKEPDAIILLKSMLLFELGLGYLGKREVGDLATLAVKFFDKTRDLDGYPTVTDFIDEARKQGNDIDKEPKIKEMISALETFSKDCSGADRPTTSNTLSQFFKKEKEEFPTELSPIKKPNPRKS